MVYAYLNIGVSDKYPPETIEFLKFFCTFFAAFYTSTYPYLLIFEN